MDMASITGAISALGFARQAANAVVELRDFNLIAAEISRVNDALLKAQDSLLSQSAALYELQSEKLEMAEELRKLKERLAERGRYSLVEIAKGQFAYRVNVAPQPSGASDPGLTEPEHYVCQPCFDKGVKSVLQRRFRFGHYVMNCSICNAFASTSERPPAPVRRRQSGGSAMTS